MAARPLLLLALSVCACSSARDRADGGTPRRAPARDAATVQAVAAADASVARALFVAVEGGCRAALDPSFPAIAAVGGSACLAYYDGPRTVVALEGGGRALEVARATATAAPRASGPALAAGRSGAFLVTVETAAGGHAIVGRTVSTDLSSMGQATPIATSVDPRYPPAVAPASGGWAAAWIDAAGTSGRAMVRLLRADGEPAEPARVLSPEASQAGGIALSAGPTGLLAAWIDPRLGFSPLYAALGSPGGLFDDAVTVLPTGSVAGVPFVTVAAGPDGQGLIAWGHMGPLGQDHLSRALFRVGGAPPRSAPVGRADAYTTLRASALRVGDGWAILWDEPTGTGRWPPTEVRAQRLAADGVATGEAQALGPGQGVAAAVLGDQVVAAFRRGTAICVARLR